MIRVAEEDGLWTVTLDRGGKANALTAAGLEALLDAVDRARDARALILTGAGAVFSAGGDLTEARAGLAVSPLWERLSGAVAALACPTVAALNGTAAGGALGMVLACDMRIAVPGAEVFYPVMRLGFPPHRSDVARLVSLLGPGRAGTILLGGARIGAEEARAWGFLDRIDEDPVSAARDLLKDALGAAPGHAASIKRMIGEAALRRDRSLRP